MGGKKKSRRIILAIDWTTLYFSRILTRDLFQQWLKVWWEKNCMAKDNYMEGLMEGAKIHTCWFCFSRIIYPDNHLISKVGKATSRLNFCLEIGEEIAWNVLSPSLLEINPKGPHDQKQKTTYTVGILAGDHVVHAHRKSHVLLVWATSMAMSVWK